MTGKVIKDGKIGALLELGSGFNPEFTGKENVYLNGKILGLSHEQINERYDQIISFAGIGDFIDQPVRTLLKWYDGKVSFFSNCEYRPRHTNY